MNKRVKSVFVFAGLSMLSIGILNFLSQASSVFKDFLTLNKVIGPYSGKVLYGLLIGVIIAFLYYKNTKESVLKTKNWIIFILICITIASLLIFTPFINFILGD